MEMVTGALLVVAGIVIGRILPDRRFRFRSPKEEVKPVCGCGHGTSFHGSDGRCNALSEVTRWDSGRWAGTDPVRCTCQRYTGPEPLPAFYAPEITD